MEIVWKVSGGCLADVWQVSFGCLKGVLRVSGRCLNSRPISDKKYRLISIVSKPIKVVVVVFVKKKLGPKNFFKKFWIQKNFGPKKCCLENSG